MAKMKKLRTFADKLIDVLHQVDRPGDVCTWGNRPLMMPGLKVSGLGLVRLPLGRTQARKLIRLCHQAPYGKGTETVIDTNVRRVWELDPEEFQLTNPMWDDCVAAIINEVQQALGLEDRKLVAELYKLLVYEEGSFFLPHRDGEKLDRMVATLVIGLPAEHKGGELIVFHDGRQHEIVFDGAASGYELSYAAFYADCQHEVRPVRSGLRLCLTYNLTLAKSRGKKAIAAPSYGATSMKLAELLHDWHSTGGAQKVAVLFDHRYSQEGLSIGTLKGIDRARAEVLFEAAEQARCEAHLALITLWQCGTADGGYDDYGYGHGRGRRYRGYSDEPEDAEYEMGEIIDDSLSANHWSDREGRSVRLGEISLDKNEIVADTALDQMDPDEEDFEGYTGNAGMTLERWYHRAGVIIWPRARHFHILCGAGTDASIGGLAPMVKRLKRAPKAGREEQHQACMAFASAIIDSWQSAPGGYRREGEDGIDRNVFPTLLCELEAPELMRHFVTQVLPADGSIELDKSFVGFCKRYGWGYVDGALATLVEATTAESANRNAALLQLLCAQRDKNPRRIALCQRLSAAAFEALKALDGQPPEPGWWAPSIDRGALLGSLVAAMIAVDAERPLARLIDHALASEAYDLTETHLAAIFAIERRLAKLPAGGSAITRWLAACREELESRTAEAPMEPTDYRRESKLTCKCQDCQALSAFLADPQRSVGRFPLAQARRGHLHSIIETNRCDCIHVTQRTGRPYVLVCTKTTASFEAARKVYERDTKSLSRIIALERKRG